MNKKNSLFYDFKYVLSEKKNTVILIVVWLFLFMLCAVGWHVNFNNLEQKFSHKLNTELGVKFIAFKDKFDNLESPIPIPYNIDSSLYFMNQDGTIINIKSVESEDTTLHFKNDYDGKMLSFSKMNQLPTRNTVIHLTNGAQVKVHWIEATNKYLNQTHFTGELVFYGKETTINPLDMWLNVNKVTHQKIDNANFLEQLILSRKIHLCEIGMYVCLFLMSISLLSIIIFLIKMRYFSYKYYYGLNKAEFEFLSIISNLSLDQRRKLLYKTFDPKNIDENFDEYNIQLKRYFQLYHNKSKLYTNIKQTNDFNMLVNHINKCKDLLHVIVDDWKTLMEQKGEFELICKELDKTINIDKIKQVEFNYQSIIEENKVNFFDITKHNFSNSEFRFFSYSRNIKLNMIFFLKGKSPAIYFNLDKYVEQNSKIIEQMKRIYFDELTE